MVVLVVLWWATWPTVSAAGWPQQARARIARGGAKIPCRRRIAPNCRVPAVVDDLSLCGSPGAIAVLAAAASARTGGRATCTSSTCRRPESADAGLLSGHVSSAGRRTLAHRAHGCPGRGCLAWQVDLHDAFQTRFLRNTCRSSSCCSAFIRSPGAIPHRGRFAGPSADEPRPSWALGRAAQPDRNDGRLDALDPSALEINRERSESSIP